MADIIHRIVASNGIRLHVAECGRAHILLIQAPSRGIRGVSSCRPSRQPGITRLRWTCAVWRSSK
jgi:hypothetical protein